MNSFAKARIERAKRTLVGRIVCRLLGEQIGAVLMEYVVLGVLVVAAAVAIVTLFGETIVEQVDIMITSLVDGAPAAKQKKLQYQQKKQGKIDDAKGIGEEIGNRGEGGGEEAEGGEI